MIKNINIEELVNIIKETIDNGKIVEFNPSGDSMSPTILSNIDTVYFQSVNDIKKYDIVLYKHDNRYILHRVISIKRNGLYNMLGDNNTFIERNISKEDIIARVVKYKHKGKEITIDDSIYHLIGLYRHISYPFRKIIRKITNNGKVNSNNP